MLEIWQLCDGDKQIKQIACEAWRVVENQYRTATRKLVESIHEQEVLEGIIESAKPELPEGYMDFSYLLFTPFRYPPLKHGSRFGTRYARSLWYGSLNIETALAEIAYYRFHLLKASETDFDELPIKYSVFKIEIETQRGVDLTNLPFSSYEEHISSPNSYTISQKLGKEMRDAKIEAFIYKSARCPQKWNNIALYTPNCFKENSFTEPLQSWEGTVTNSKRNIEFIRTNGLNKEMKQFVSDLFMIDGELPYPTT